MIRGTDEVGITTGEDIIPMAEEAGMVIVEVIEEDMEAEATTEAEECDGTVGTATTRIVAITMVEGLARQSATEEESEIVKGAPYHLVGVHMRNAADLYPIDQKKERGPSALEDVLGPRRGQGPLFIVHRDRQAHHRSILERRRLAVHQERMRVETEKVLH